MHNQNTNWLIQVLARSFDIIKCVNTYILDNHVDKLIIFSWEQWLALRRADSTRGAKKWGRIHFLDFLAFLADFLALDFLALGFLALADFAFLAFLGFFAFLAFLGFLAFFAFLAFFFLGFLGFLAFFFFGAFLAAAPRRKASRSTSSLGLHKPALGHSLPHVATDERSKLLHVALVVGGDVLLDGCQGRTFAILQSSNGSIDHLCNGWMRHGPLRPRPFGCLLRRFSWWRRHHGRENFTLKTLDSDKIIVGSPNLVMSSRGPEREPPRAIRVTQTWRTKWPV